MTIDFKTCSLTGLTTIMSNARRMGGPKAEAARLAAALELQDRHRQAHTDPVAGACHGTIALMDHCRFEQTGKRLKSNRSRQAMKNHGEIAFMELVTRGKSEGSGFELLLAAGLGRCTVEYLVAAHFERFPADAVEAAKARLLAHGIPLPHRRDGDVEQSASDGSSVPLSRFAQCENDRLHRS